MKKLLFLLAIIYGTIFYVSAQNTYPWPQSGKVGFGTTSPISILEIEGMVGEDPFFIIDGNRSYIMEGSSSIFEVNLSPYFDPINQFAVPGFTALKVDKEGTVTIGKNSISSIPSLKVIGGAHFFESVSLNDQTLYLRGDHNHFLGFHSSFAGQAMDGPVLAGYASGMLGTTQDGNSFSLFWNKDGKVGISTTNLAGDHKLYVGGSILAEEVVVKLQNNWPDYVFDENFELLSLDKVEDFIKKENHLPGIPSAEDISKNGVEVGEMNAILVKKVEELTLYVIELNKEIERLKEE